MLTDWALERLVYKSGPVAAERVVSGLAVLIFFWGAFFAVDVATGRRPGLFCSYCSPVLSYGLVFHFGFLNFYLSAGLCFWILGLLWQPSPSRAMIAAPLIVLAWLAHALPVLWVGSGIGVSVCVSKDSDALADGCAPGRHRDTRGSAGHSDESLPEQLVARSGLELKRYCIAHRRGADLPIRYEVSDSERRDLDRPASTFSGTHRPRGPTSKIPRIKSGCCTW